jgi:hypothetical protein
MVPSIITLYDVPAPDVGLSCKRKHVQNPGKNLS